MDGLLRSTPFEWRWRDVFVFLSIFICTSPSNQRRRKKLVKLTDDFSYHVGRNRDVENFEMESASIDEISAEASFKGSLPRAVEWRVARWMLTRDGCPPKKSVGGGHWRAIELLVFYWINSAHPHTHTQMVSGGVENPLTTREALLSKAIGKLFSSFRLSLSKTFISSTTRMCVCVVNGSSLARKFTFRRLLVLYFQNKNYY